MANYLLKFGGYTFPNSLRPATEGRSQDLAEQQRPRTDGAASQAARREPTILTIQGEITAPTADGLASLHQGLLTALGQGKQNLYFGRDDRFYRDVQYKSLTTSYEDGKTFGLFAVYSISLSANDYPLAFDANPVTTSIGTTGATVTNGGDASGLPAWTINVSGAGTGPITLTNTTTGESCTLTPATAFAASDVIVLTRDGYAVTLDGAANFGLLSGRIPTLAAGANVITLTSGGTATLATSSVTFTPRYF